MKIANVQRGHLDLDSIASYVSAIDAEKAKKFRLHRGDIVVGMTGYVGEVARVTNYSPLLLNQRVGLVSPDLELVHPGFLFYALSTSEFRSAAVSLGTGSAQANVSPTQLQSIEVPLPPLEEQERITDVLGTFDDLMEANRRLIEALQNVISATYGLTASFSTSPASLRTVANHLPGKYLKKAAYQLGGIYPVYGSNSVMGSHSHFLYEGPMTVLARIGSNCGALRLSTEPAWINNNASVIKAKDSTLQYRLHETLRRIDMNRHRTGSGQPFIRTDSLMDEMVPWPERASAWDQSASVMLNVAEELAAESRDLAWERDELLPLLMSGRVRVRDLEGAA